MIHFILDAATNPCEEKFYNTSWFGLIVGVVSLMLGWGVSYFQARSAAKQNAALEAKRDKDNADLEARREKEEVAAELHARRIALIAELDYLLKCIKEIRGVICTEQQACIKRLNSDFLESCRLDWYKADSDAAFIQLLSAVFQDVVLTNIQLEMVVQLAQQANLFGKITPNMSNLGSVTAALDGVERSVTSLKQMTENKIK